MTEGQREKKRRKRARVRQRKIEEQLSAVVPCPYCTVQAKCVPDSFVYGRSYGSHIWWCSPCNAYVGCHKGTYIAKGRLSNAALRKLKVEAHALFDPFWKTAVELRGWTQSHARHMAYSWLSGAMGIRVVDCHIGMFDDEQTLRVIEICRTHLEGRRAA